MSTQSLSIEAPEAFIEWLTAIEIEGMRSGVPVRSSSPVDLLDAPMNRKKLLGNLQIITLLFTTATGGVKFAEEVEKFLKDNPGIVIMVRDAVSGASFGKYDSETPPTPLIKHFNI